MLKSAASGELHAEDFILGENQEIGTNRNSKRGKRWALVVGECGARRYFQRADVRCAEVACELSSVASLISCLNCPRRGGGIFGRSNWPSYHDVSCACMDASAGVTTRA